MPGTALVCTGARDDELRAVSGTCLLPSSEHTILVASQYRWAYIVLLLDNAT